MVSVMTDEEILRHWDYGQDTVDISRLAHVHESEITKRLSRLLHERLKQRQQRPLTPYVGRK